MTLSEKDPAEIITATFDFTGLAETIASSTVTIAAAQGLADADPSAMISGANSIAGALVMQRIAGGQPGTTYSLRCVANDADGEIHVLTAALPVRTASPI